MDIQKIINSLENIKTKTITVFGDYCLDKYLYIDPERDELSLETGLVAYQAKKKALFPGAGGTVVNNLRALGVQVLCVGLLGDDGEGYELLKGLNQTGADTKYMVQSKDLITSTYVKPMRGKPGEVYTEMNRIDIRGFAETTKELEDRLITNLEKAIAVSDGILVIEQFLERNCYAITDRIREKLAELASINPQKVFYADSRGFTDCYKDIIIKCNQFELEKAVGNGSVRNNSKSNELINNDELISNGKKLLSYNGRAVIVTLGADGAYVFENDEVTAVDPFIVEGPLDIVGAGDSTSAGIVLGQTLGLTLPEATMLGGCISSITIQQLGVTGTASVKQVKERLKEKL